MKRLALQKSKTGFVAAGLFLLTFLGLLAWIFFVASKNPADSGESGVLLLPFAAKPSRTFLPDTLKTSLCANRLFPTGRLSSKKVRDSFFGGRQVPD